MKKIAIEYIFQCSIVQNVVGYFCRKKRMKVVKVLRRVEQISKRKNTQCLVLTKQKKRQLVTYNLL